MAGLVRYLRAGWIACALLAVTATASPAPAAEAAPSEPPVYVFGVVPQFEARELAGIWEPILTELERRTGCRFVLRGSARIPVFEGSFLAGEFDFAYMNPYHCLMAMEGQGYIPLVRDGARELSGVLVVRKDGPWQTVADLQDRQISFPAPNALGASLLMRAELTRDFGLRFTPVYAQTHTSSYLNVVLGATAAAGGVRRTLQKLDAGLREQLVIIHETAGMAPHPVVTHPRVPAAVRDAVRNALLAMGEDEAGRALLARVPIRQVTPATVADYEPLRAFGLDAFYVE